MSLLFQIKDLSLSLPHKICFEPFSADIYAGARIAVIGNNGAGKSLLLKSLTGGHDLCDGQLRPLGRLSYIPQTVSEYNDLSGGERFNKALSSAIADMPDILLLDEPTNHLDRDNRKSLMRMIRGFPGAVIAATHDVEFIESCFNTVWHINNGKVIMFNGAYRDYRAMNEQEKASVEHEIAKIKYEKKALHNDLMKEQTRAKNAKLAGDKKYENKRILKAKYNHMKAQGGSSTGKRKSEIRDSKDELNKRLSDLYAPEVLTPRFNLPHRWRSGEAVLQIVDGSIGYDAVLLENINLTLGASERMALLGGNGSGKTSLIKALMNDKALWRSGSWHIVPGDAIAYLDQHYENLDPDRTVFETVRDAAPQAGDAELRAHLNDFLFRKNEEINNKTARLSGGEKARLSLAVIALRAPALLILDEISNNVDLLTKEHIAQILREYPGALLVISHDSAFLEDIAVEKSYDIDNMIVY